MSFDFDKANKVVDLLIGKLELHAIVLVLVGAVLSLKGKADLATMMLGAGLAILKGGRS